MLESIPTYSKLGEITAASLMIAAFMSIEAGVSKEEVQESFAAIYDVLAAERADKAKR